MSTAAEISTALQALGNADIAEHSRRFFKTGSGEYGEGDRFLGIRVPVLRKQVTRFADTSIDEVIKLLQSDFHEERLLALLLLVRQFSKSEEQQQQAIYEHYLANTHRVNGWDLVDSSAHLIVGPWLAERPRDVLYQLAGSEMLWERRIAMMATYHFIRAGDFEDALALAALLINDKEDLMHKIVGWMLREIGNRDREAEEAFLRDHYQNMPRTMLRYAIEKFSEDLRQGYLKGTI